MPEIIPTLFPATMDDYPMIQNMARFMTYEMSKYCGLESEDWWMPNNGLYECYDFKRFFDDPNHKVFIVKMDRELAGFVIITKGSNKINWLVQEFYIVGKYHGKGVAKFIAHQVWKDHPGSWELSVIPENAPALGFWRKAAGEIVEGKFQEELRKVDYDDYQPYRHFLSFII